MNCIIEVEISQAINLQKNNMKQSLITDHFEKLLCIKSIRTVSYSEYKSLQMQNYLRRIISDTFAKIFGPWILKWQGHLTKIYFGEPLIKFWRGFLQKGPQHLNHKWQHFWNLIKLFLSERSRIKVRNMSIWQINEKKW